MSKLSKFHGRRLFIAAAASALVLPGCSSDSDDDSPPPGRIPSARFDMEAVQLAYIGSGMHGSGILTYQGRSYTLDVTGLGIGGLGVSRIIAQGEVYDMYNLRDFTGVYGQARTGWAVASKGSGKMWLQNSRDVVIHLKAERKGLQLALGLDGLDIKFAG